MFILIKQGTNKKNNSVHRMLSKSGAPRKGDEYVSAPLASTIVSSSSGRDKEAWRLAGFVPLNLAEVAARAANKGTHTSATQSVSVTPLSLSAPVTNKRM